MKNSLIAISMLLILTSCAATTSDGPRRSQITSCPLGMVLICESGRAQEPSRGGDEEIPEYDSCRCEQIM